MKIKFIYISILFLSTSILFSCKEEVKQLIPEKYNDADAVYLDITKEYTLNEDGSFDYNYSHKLKYQSFLSFNRLYGETFITYNPEYQKLTVSKSKTTMADGKIVNSPENAFNEVLPSFATNYPAYNHLREMVVTHTGLEKGAAVELNYNIHSSKEFAPALMGKEVIALGSPIVKMNVIVKTPLDKEFNYSIINDTIEPTISTTDKFKVYEWNFSEIDARTHEHNSLSNSKEIVFSTISPKDARNYLTNQPSFDFTLSDNMKAFVKKTTKGKLSDLEKAFKIQDKVVNELNSYHIPLYYTGFVTNAPITTWNSNGGNEIDKAILMSAMINNLGINAEVVATIPTKYASAKVGLINYFDEYFVKINIDENDTYLSAAYINNRNTLQTISNKTIVTLSDNVSEKSIINVPNNLGNLENKIDFTAELKYNKYKKLSGKGSLLLSNNCYPYFKIAKDASYSKTLVPFFNTKRNKTIEINDNSISLEFKLDKKEPFKEQANYLFWELPKSSYGVESWHLGNQYNDRRSNIELPYSINESYKYTIELPENIKLVKANKISKENKVGSIIIETSITENTLTIVRNIKILSNKVLVVDYNDFQKIIKLWRSNKEIILKDITE